MHGSRRARLVACMADVLAEFPALESANTAELLPTTGLPGAQRRARLALRIAILNRPPSPHVLMEADVKPPVPDGPEPVPATEPLAVAQPPQKPARITMSTLRLEDAALLLAAASESSEPQGATVDTPVKMSAFATVMHPTAGSKAAGIKNMGDAFATLSVFDETTLPPDPESDEAGSLARPDDGTSQDEPKPTAGKTKRRSGSISALDGLANAAAALADLQSNDAGNQTTKRSDPGVAGLTERNAGADEP